MPRYEKKGEVMLDGADEALIALERAFIAEPDDLEAAAVFADRLQELGDPRGELIARGVAAKLSGDYREHQRYLEANSATLLGNFDRRSPGVEVSWDRGVIDAASFNDRYNPELLDAIEGLLTCPAGSLTRAVNIGMIGDDELEPSYRTTIDRLVKTGPHRSLQSLWLGMLDYPYEIEISWVRVGDLGPLWTVLPNLRHLKVSGGEIELGEVSAPELVSLTLHTSGLPREVLERIAAASWPKLEALELWLGSVQYNGDATVEDIEALVDTSMPRLAHLGLMNSMLSDEIAARVGRSELLEQLVSLDFSMGTLSDSGARVLLSSMNAFSHLECLNLSDNYLTDKTIPELRQYPFVVVGEQKIVDPDGYAFVTVSR